MFPKYIKNASDLQTTRQAICEGFLEQAFAKVDQADPFVKRAKKFYKALRFSKTIDDVIALSGFRDELISASGFSDKGKSKFTKIRLDRALKKVLEKIFKESGHDLREELVYRYLLTRGDSLGGSMRNITGLVANNKLVGLITKTLSKQGIKIHITKSGSGKIQSVVWAKRKLFFDKTPKFIGKNIDIILIKAVGKDDKDLLENHSNYLACGELKGGIDPAGADEHWKTANSALSRIKRAFSGKPPNLFFIGAAIEVAMAKEIFDQLKGGELSYAANLTKQKQLQDLVDWLISL